MHDSNNEIINIRDFYNHETRIALVEQSIIRIDSTMADIRTILIKMDEKIDKVNDRIDKTNDKIESNFKWTLGIMIAGFSGLFGVMAHEFHWIV